MDSLIQIQSTVDKEYIQTLPRVLFDGRIEVINSLREVDSAVRFLKKQPILGLDTETRPNFSKNTNYKVSLLQVSTLNICFLFRLNFIGLPDSLVQLLSNDTPLKVGLSFQDDVRMLRQRSENLKMGKFVELQKLASEFGIADKSLQKLYANLFHKRISKNQQLSNWNADILSEPQKRYAATDAWACIRLYNIFQKMKRHHNFIVASTVSLDKLIDEVIHDMLNTPQTIEQ